MQLALFIIVSIVCCLGLAAILSKIPFLAVPKNRRKINIGMAVLVVLTIIIEYLHSSKGWYLLGFKSNLYWIACVFLTLCLVILVNSNPIKTKLWGWLLVAALPFFVFTFCLMLMSTTGDRVLYDKYPYRLENYTPFGGGLPHFCFFWDKGFYEKMYRIDLADYYKARGMHWTYVDILSEKEIQLQEKGGGLIEIRFVGEITDTVNVELY